MARYYARINLFCTFTPIYGKLNNTYIPELYGKQKFSNHCRTL